MKKEKKAVMAVALLACTAMFTVAQTALISENIVGYNKFVAPGAGLHISAMQFLVLDGSNTIQSVYGESLPSGTRIYVWTGTSYAVATYGPVFVPGQGLVTKWNQPDLKLNNGDGYWVEVPVAASSMLAGEVSRAESITHTIATGLQLVSYPYPVERTVGTLGLNPSSGDRVYIWGWHILRDSHVRPGFRAWPRSGNQVGSA